MQGPDGIFICDECVSLCSDVLASHGYMDASGTMPPQRLAMKDVITLVIFNVAILIVMVVVKMLITVLATPAFNYLAYVGVMALACQSWLYPLPVENRSLQRDGN